MHTRPSWAFVQVTVYTKLPYHLLHIKDDFPFKKQYKEVLNMILREMIP